MIKEMAPMAVSLEKTQILEIWETEEKKLSIGKLKYNYLQIARRRFQ